MATLYENLQGGVTTDNPLSSGATTINSTAFQYMRAVTGSDVMYVTLDPEGANGAPEIVKVTAHTASATSVTVVRAQQSTTARAHPVSTVWVHALTSTDLDAFGTDIGTDDLVDGAVTTAKLADANVTTAKLADANVTTAKILDANVTTAKLADDAVTSAKLAEPFEWKTDWTPTFQANGLSAITAGNGAWSAKHLRVGNVGWISAEFTVGSTTVLASRSPSIDMPSGWTANGPAYGRLFYAGSVNGVTYLLELAVGAPLTGYSTFRVSDTLIHTFLLATANPMIWNVYGDVTAGGTPVTGSVLHYVIGPIPLA